MLGAVLWYLQREELVLLLIQLRRSNTKLEEMRVWVRDKLAHRRPDEKAYRIQFVLLNFCTYTSSYKFLSYFILDRKDVEPSH